ncbi:hypothetical protein CCU68_05925 [Pseudomonas gingeri NCPPB 3146 = LMG 5327]|uniref:Uncharacterized protein n=2 Tax=Pseudomonas gingeri TaxID=117681 RepID=A0A7Y8CDQ0_9PSED|nr:MULTISPECIES: hypothetical protein [Pseudomonas]NVZ63116.1 hypothetical protein [Pseudomonas gingeri]NVZ78235.1 hypothetical protein [Pseudomonas gingeri]NWC14186.1 hypothetical protein [Pseudomonas gingeri]NWE47856.1 hypothetical protein [Pseudomonas gingeri]PNQ93545.1 hypothetical protein CCU68_05925 [Pseudomonas gingeri NCPPB 3146 = LMG 5327]
MSADMPLQVVASLLRRGRSLDQLSTGLTVLGVLSGLAPLLIGTLSSWCLLLSVWLVLTGLLQKYWALRVAFDADLFQLMAGEPSGLGDRTEALDQALHDLGLQPRHTPARPWAERSRGALGLLKRQALLLIVQISLPLIVILASPWLPFAR